jgi:TPR repeat protein
MQKIFLNLLVLALVQTAHCQTSADSGLPEDDLSLNPLDQRLSTNWYASVEAVLPPGDAGSLTFNFQEATNYLRQESQHGNLRAQALWGTALVVQSNSPAAVDSGLQMLSDSAQKGCVGAMLTLGNMFEGGICVPTNYDEAFRWFKQAADAGNAQGELQLGGCYSYGLGTAKDLTMATKYYRLSAEQTNYVAMKSLGYHLMNGYGVKTNEDEAKYWFTRAALEGGNRRAMYNLGVIYMLKYPDTNAMVEAFKWMKKAAELGDALAAQELANFYYRGWGATGPDLDMYHFWRTMAASRGATDSQFFMGQAYRQGDGVPKDSEASLTWYARAAAKNHPEALYDLALHYLEDKTNRASLQTAHEYMLRAARM